MRPHPLRSQPHLDLLEDRVVPAVTAAFSGGVLTVFGDAANNTILVGAVGGSLFINGDGALVPIAGGTPTVFNTALIRVVAAVTVLDASLLPLLVRYLMPIAIAALIALALAWRSLRRSEAEKPEAKNPLQLRNAIEMALLFQVVLFAVFYVREWIGDVGLMASGFLLGLTDVDAALSGLDRGERPAIAARLGRHLDRWGWMRDRDLLFEPWDTPRRVIETALSTEPHAPVSYRDNLRRQFEFIQQTWLTNPTFANLRGEMDPLVGHDETLSRFTMPGFPARRCLASVPQFVRLLGGGYFFLPSLPALRFLAGR